ncbi:MAG: S-layer homology domain-containing protein [Clostridia bacterium]|nr:S-layer homology domain-containing protein [Clostridia bacterium]
MKKVFLTTAIVVCIICAMAITATAEGEPSVTVVDNWNGIVAVSGTAEPGTYVSLTVFNPNYAESSFAAGTQAAIGHYDGVVAKDANDCAHAGNYCFHFKINGGGGDYTIIANADNTKFSQTLAFYPVTAKQQSIKDINTAANAGTISGEILNTAMTNFSLKDIPLYAGTDKSAVAAALKALKPAGGFLWSAPADIDAMAVTLKTACLIAAYNTDNSAVLTSEGSLLYLEDMMALSGTDELADYTNKIADKSLVMNDIFASSYTTIPQIEEAFKKSVRFRVLVDYIERGYGHIAGYFTKYNTYYTEVGFDFTTFNGIASKGEIYSAVAASTASDIITLASEFNTWLVTSGSDATTSGGGGGSISFGGGGGSAPDKSDEETEKEPETPVEPDPPAEPQTPVVETVGGFADVPVTHWAAEPIKVLAEEGILTGRGDGSFDIDGTITRAELIKIAVVSTLGETDATAENPFTDSAEHWAKSHIATAVKAGITTGVTDKEFNPDGLITREQAATILYRAVVAKGITLEKAGETFADDASISDWAKDAVYALKAAGVISGRDGNNFCAGESLTRAEAAKLVYTLRNLK